MILSDGAPESSRCGTVEAGRRSQEYTRPRDTPRHRAGGVLRAVRRSDEGVLERLLDALIGSDAFERLLLERARPILARADAG